eukprot:266062-Pelagomonas_calceolata.AAC.2
MQASREAMVTHACAALTRKEMVMSVLPRPISSARMAFRPWSYCFTSHCTGKGTVEDTASSQSTVSAWLSDGKEKPWSYYITVHCTGRT